MAHVQLVSTFALYTSSDKRSDDWSGKLRRMSTPTLSIRGSLRTVRLAIVIANTNANRARTRIAIAKCSLWKRKTRS